MNKAIIPLFSSGLLLFAVALTQVSSSNYQFVMSVSSLCAAVAAGGLVLSTKGKPPSVRIAFAILAVVGSLITIWSVAFVVSARLNH
jgi:hypothetical protein